MAVTGQECILLRKSLPAMFTHISALAQYEIAGFAVKTEIFDLLHSVIVDMQHCICTGRANLLSFLC